jgi:D-tyrosyl-tRNA(Tyr) deacylase
VEPEDSKEKADRLLQRLLGYRVFPDGEDRMNLSLRDIDGGLLLVPQFTLAADTRKGTRPGFSTAAAPEQGLLLYDYLCERARTSHRAVANGVFGANMQVSLTNDGPVTFWLQV